MRLLLLLMTALLIATPARADDKREGYYYPPITSEETFSRSINNPPPANRAIRTGFITEVTKAQYAAPEAPEYAIFAKGSDADHMIIIALDDDIFRSLFRARAVMAQLSSNARSTDFFRNNDLQFVATWFDLAKMLGFKDIVISDGMSWSHKIHIE
ncbi:MAG: hypothetical protein AAFV19_01575 [Pseudomonadota bacterium]